MLTAEEMAASGRPQAIFLCIKMQQLLDFYVDNYQDAYKYASEERYMKYQGRAYDNPPQRAIENESILSEASRLPLLLPLFRRR